MFMFKVTPHNKLILICDDAAYVAPPFKNLDVDPTYKRTVMARYDVPSLIDDPQCDVCLRQSRNAT
jgi:hypothetical protein